MRRKIQEHPAYALMLAEVQKHGVLQHHLEDLTTHDRAALSRKLPSTRFAWIPYRYGTHFMWEGITARDFAAMAKCCAEEHGTRIYVWDGVSTLTCYEDNAAEAYALLADPYACPIHECDLRNCDHGIGRLKHATAAGAYLAQGGAA